MLTNCCRYAAAVGSCCLGVTWSYKGDCNNFYSFGALHTLCHMHTYGCGKLVILHAHTHTYAAHTCMNMRLVYICIHVVISSTSRSVNSHIHAHTCTRAHIHTHTHRCTPLKCPSRAVHSYTVHRYDIVYYRNVPHTIASTHACTHTYAHIHTHKHFPQAPSSSAVHASGWKMFMTLEKVVEACGWYLLHSLLFVLLSAK